MQEVLFLKPVFKEMIWGGDKLSSQFGYSIPSSHTGECWAVSAHPNGDCTVLGGMYEGKKLSDLWETHRELFGGLKGDRFPLLTKIIDAKADLSIQVHPDDSYAAVNENGALGKTECWYVLDCDEDAAIVIGHNAKCKDEMKTMICEKRWKEFIREIPLKKGDFFQIDPGCIHAIKGGSLILETQQNSDITYRVYDYDRLSDGCPRELHLEKSIDVITVPFVEKKLNPVTVSEKAYDRTEYITCPYYKVEKIDIKSQAVFNQDMPFQIMSVISGNGSIDGTKIKKGDHFIIPFGYGEYTLEGKMEIILSEVPEKQ